MKMPLMLYLLAFGGTINMLAQQANGDRLDLVKQLLASTEDRMKAQGRDFPEAVGESGNLLGKIPEFQTLEKGADVLWEDALDNLSTVAPTEISKIIFARACQNMAPENYVQFLNAAASQCDQKNISKMLLTVAIYPDNKLRYILVDNYQDRNVVAFCQHAKRIWADDPAMAQMFDVILSGKSKKGIDDMRKAGALDVPELKLSSATTPNFPRVAALPESKSVSQTSPNDLPVSSTHFEHTSTVPAERGRPRWPWAAGLAALFIIVMLLSRRRR